MPSSSSSCIVCELRVLMSMSIYCACAQRHVFVLHSSTRLTSTVHCYALEHTRTQSPQSNRRTRAARQHLGNACVPGHTSERKQSASASSSTSSTFEMSKPRDPSCRHRRTQPTRTRAPRQPTRRRNDHRHSLCQYSTCTPPAAYDPLRRRRGRARFDTQSRPRPLHTHARTLTHIGTCMYVCNMRPRHTRTKYVRAT